jgi:hypothetical protein
LSRHGRPGAADGDNRDDDGYGKEPLRHRRQFPGIDLVD